MGQLEDWLEVRFPSVKKPSTTASSVYEEVAKFYRNKYRKILAHRRQCASWKTGKRCWDCFGGGLNEYTGIYL